MSKSGRENSAPSYWQIGRRKLTRFTWFAAVNLAWVY
jgi:hypothetical protein